MNKAELKQQVIELADNLDIGDGNFLDLILDNASEGTLKDTLDKLKQWERIEKLKNHFKTNNVENTPDGYPDEFTINDELNIEVVTKADAIENELDFINTEEEKNEFLLEIAKEISPEEIGAYKQIETNLYYREL